MLCAFVMGKWELIWVVWYSLCLFTFLVLQNSSTLMAHNVRSRTHLTPNKFIQEARTKSLAASSYTPLKLPVRTGRTRGFETQWKHLTTEDTLPDLTKGKVVCAKANWRIIIKGKTCIMVHLLKILEVEIRVTKQVTIISDSLIHKNQNLKWKNIFLNQINSYRFIWFEWLKRPVTSNPIQVFLRFYNSLI